MPTVITVERESASSSRSNSFTDEGSSTGTGVHVSPTSGSQENSDLLDDDQSWDPVYSDEIEPSESASRPRPPHYRRSNSRPTSVRRGPVRRHTTTERTSHRRPLSRVRHAAPAPPSSVDPQEDYPGYGRGFLPPNGPYGGRAPQPGYAPSFVSIPPNPFQGNAGQVMPYGGPAAYPYPQNPFSPAQGVGGQGFFPPHQTAAYGAPGYGGHEVMPYNQAPGYGYGGYGIPPQVPQSQFYAHYAERPPSPSRKGTPAPAASVVAAEKEKTEIEKKLAALEKQLEDAKLEAERTKKEAERVKRETEEKQMASLIEEEKKRREAEEKKLAALERLLEDTKHDAAKAKKQVAEREAADKKAADEAAIKEATDKKVKEEVGKVKAEAEKKTKAAEEATKKAEEEKKQADEAKAKAEAEAKALSAPSDKKKPLKFKDAVGRKFSFPFHICQTWAGMEELIRQAFMHVPVIGPHVAEGHYDLVGPNGEIILPQVWETMIEPDWAITMHMWPMPEAPRGPPDGVTIVDADPRMGRPGPRRGRGERPHMPPQGHSGRRGPLPPPPPGWIGPPPGRMGGHEAEGGIDEVIVIDDNGTVKSGRKKQPKDTGGFLGFGGGNRKPSGKGLKKSELYDACQVM